MQESEVRFHKLMNALAAQTRYELDEVTIEVYDKHLSHLDYDRVCAALERILVNLAPDARFPTVKAIINEVGGKPSSEAASIESANRIIGAVGKKGYAWLWGADPSEHKRIISEELGELSYHVIMQMGGWSRVHSMINESRNLESMRAQLKNTAAGIYQKAEQGKLNELPSLPESGTPNKVGQARVNHLIGTTAKGMPK